MEPATTTTTTPFIFDVLSVIASFCDEETICNVALTHTDWMEAVVAADELWGSTLPRTLTYNRRDDAYDGGVRLVSCLGALFRRRVAFERLHYCPSASSSTTTTTANHHHHLVVTDLLRLHAFATTYNHLMLHPTVLQGIHAFSTNPLLLTCFQQRLLPAILSGNKTVLALTDPNTARGEGHFCVSVVAVEVLSRCMWSPVGTELDPTSAQQQEMIPRGPWADPDTLHHRQQEPSAATPAVLILIPLAGQADVIRHNILNLGAYLPLQDGVDDSDEPSWVYHLTEKFSEHNFDHRRTHDTMREKLRRKRPLAIIATPETLWNLIETGEGMSDLYCFSSIDLTQVKLCAVCETDVMRDCRLLGHVGSIVEALPPTAQVVASARSNTEIFEDTDSKLAKRLLCDSVHVREPTVTLPQLRYAKHFYVDCQDEKWKLETLLDLLESLQYNQAIIVTSSKRGAAWIHEGLLKNEHPASPPVNGDLNQAQRNKVFSDFTNGTYRLLVITEICLRGADCFPHRAPVIAFDLPSPSAYVHFAAPIGRLSPRTHLIISFLAASQDPSQVRKLKEVEDFNNITIEELPVEGSFFDCR